MRLLQPSRGDHAAEIERACKTTLLTRMAICGNPRPCYEPVVVDLHADALNTCCAIYRCAQWTPRCPFAACSSGPTGTH